MKLRNIRKAGVFAFVLIAAAVTTFSQVPRPMDTGFGGGNILQGTVHLPSGQPGGRLQIRIASQVSGDRVHMTDEGGHFAFSGLPPGDFTVSIDREEVFKPVSQTLSVIQAFGSPPRTYYMQLRLEYKPGQELAPGVINAQFSEVPQNALIIYNKGVELAGQGDHRGAIEQFKLAIAEYPQFMLAFNEMGVQHLRLGELQLADEALLKAVELKPDAFAPVMNRGMVLFHLKRYSEAAGVLKKAVHLNAEAPVGHYFYGQALANLGLFDQAEKELVIALKSGQAEMNEGHRILAIIYNSRGDKKKAVTHLEAYLKGNPKAADAEQLQALVKQLKASQ
jgi:tetratricopeptide (TPR) repeat protein